MLKLSLTFRNPLYEVHFLILVKYAYLKLARGATQCWKAVRMDRMWHLSSPVIAHKPWYPT